MLLDRRRFSGLLAGVVGGVALPRQASQAAMPPADPCHLPDRITALKPMTAGVVPITTVERQARLARARELMGEMKLNAIIIEPGATMDYFTGVQWSLSERPFVVVIPARGEPAYVCPGFEEGRARELTAAAEVRVWQEDQSAAELIAGVLRDRGAATGRVGIEERLRFFIADGVRQAVSAAEFVSATPVTAGCRMIKSPAELALMQRANDITIAAFRAAFATMKPGMLNTDMVEIMNGAQQRLGGEDAWTLALIGPASAFPHGTIQPQRLKEGDVVLVDSGCAVKGYQSDVTRTTVFGKASARQVDVWNLERTAQDAAFAAAKVGVRCEAVDAAARQVITTAGFGPGYRVPGLPHRTGHGIGMEGHEWTYFVRGNATPIQPGMCFSDEPTIAIPGEFGIRLEDCLYITPSGPKFFTPQAEAIDRPVP